MRCKKYILWYNIYIIRTKRGVDMKSMFITFEGNDGSGKSSVIEAIREELTKRGYDIVLTREPGGSKIAEK